MINGTRYPTWQWVAMGFAATLLAISGWMYATLATSVHDLSREKLDKEIYYRDIDRLDNKIERVDKKMDRALNLLVEHAQDRP